MDIEEAKDWLASIDVHSETEASYKELILSTIDKLDKENNELRRVYESVANKLYESESDINKQLSMYLYAQICDNIAFEISGTDYYDEYYKLRNKIRQEYKKQCELFNSKNQKETDFNLLYFCEKLLKEEVEIL